MAEQSSPSSAKAQVLNDRTYQEVEYLKKNLGPILVAALAEICIRRPADPIEYLGHWLLRWRYNEELKRRDVQNALEVVRQKAWTKDDESLQNPNAPSQAPGPETFTQGFVPGSAYAPPGYGGPLDQNVVEEAMKPEAAEGEQVEGQRSTEGTEGKQSVEGAEGMPSGEGQAENRKSGDVADAASRKSGDATQKTSGERQQASTNEMGADGQQASKTSAERRTSQLGDQSGQALEGQASSVQEKRASGQEQRASGEKISKVGSGEKQGEEASRASRRSVDQAEKRASGQADLNNSEAPPTATASAAEQGEEEETIPE